MDRIQGEELKMILSFQLTDVGQGPQESQVAYGLLQMLLC